MRRHCSHASWRGQWQDQTYFLNSFRKEQLQKPCSHWDIWKKPEVPKPCRRADLSTAKKKDSTSLLYRRKRTLKGFHSSYLPSSTWSHDDCGWSRYGRACGSYVLYDWSAWRAGIGGATSGGDNAPLVSLSEKDLSKNILYVGQGFSMIRSCQPT